jgi:cholesterol transport system auxiliary component
LLLGFWGCVGAKQPVPNIDYYTLEYDPPKVDMRKRTGVVIRVERFQVAPYYNTTNIIYRENRFKRDAYHYQKWRANPGDLVTYFLARDLRESGLFQGVFVLSSKFPASHSIDGILDAFYQASIQDVWEAVLSFSVTLMAEYEPDISRRILFQKHYEIREKCAYKNPRALAEAMSKALAGLSKKVISDVYQTLAE